MRGKLALWAIAAACLAVSACAPSLVVRHMDPSHPVAVVWIDGEIVGNVKFGKEASFGITQGPHRVRARLPKTETSPWHPELDAVPVVIDEGATLTLLPPDVEGPVPGA